MRQRKGWTQTEAARAVGVRQAQVARWERGDTWPDNERLHALCWHLGARPEEAAALTSGDIMSFADTTPLSLVTARSGETSGDLDQWRSYLNGLLYTSVPEDSLIDLTMLAAESRLARLAQGTPSAAELVASAYGVHARLHMNRGQFRLGRHWADKGLAEMSSHRAVFTQAAAISRNALWFGNVASLCADASVRDNRPDRERAVVVVKRWLEALPPTDVGHRSWGLLCLGRLFSETGRRDEAAAMLLAAAKEDNSPAMDAGFRRRIVAAIRAIDSGHYRSARSALADCDSMISARSDPSMTDSVREARRLLDRIDRAR
jgi:DNA-binding XRE family transcriptional regulator